ncbi:hypothetical protein MVEN_00759500 [Mycena venus]|uniref:F-box domain-containing protein n=1 Tax=Mycena venus TaxID=2733690 RepID=A0A8H6YFM6_9AGAR|nr:hypothetical protein MVEN_00759500 [Mycena venus]
MEGDIAPEPRHLGKAMLWLWYRRELRFGTIQTHPEPLCRDMSVIPPELLDAIVCEIDDVQTLKSCSLVASTLRYSSQRILLSSLTIGKKKYAHACKLLTESLHIAGYVTRLTIKLGSLRNVLASADVETFVQILDKLQNVRRCTVDGMWYKSTFSNFSERSRIPPFLLDFFLRQPLQELHLRLIDVDPAVLWRVLALAPTLHLRTVIMDERIDVLSTAAVPPPSPSLDSLHLMNGTIGQFLAHPQNVSCVASLRHLLVESYDNWAGPMIEAASHTLEHIQFDTPNYFSGGCSPPMLPRLPALRIVQFTFPGLIIAAATAELISAAAKSLSSLATPQMSPALADVVIKQRSAKDGVFDASPYVPLMTMLDAALAAYPSPPCVHWVLATDKEEPTTSLAHFADGVRRAMPKAGSTGRLVLEAYLQSRVFGRADGALYPLGESS